MSSHHLTQEEIEATLELYESLGRNTTATARELGITRASMQHRLRRMKRKGLLPDVQPGPGFEVASESVQYDADGEVKGRTMRTKTAAEKDYTQRVGFSVSKTTTQVGPDGRVEREWIRESPEEVAREAQNEALVEAMKHLKPHPPVAKPKGLDSDLLTVYPLPDLHLGQLSWGLETGQDYDLDIAVKRCTDTIKHLISVSPPSETAIILIAGDFFHADDQRNVTPGHGHQLDVDGRYQKVFMAGADLCMSLVSAALHKHDKVIVRVLPGNHDVTAAPSLAVGLGMAYRDSKRVEIDMSPARYWFYEHGQNLLAATHGDQCKTAQLPGIMATMKREAWGRTAYKTAFTGHRHNLQVQSVSGVVCIQLNAGTLPDAYSVGNGFATGVNGLSAYTYCAKRGAVSVMSDLFAPADLG